MRDSKLCMLFCDDFSEYRIGRSLLVRGMGLIYLIAILSWWSQAMLLVGENGLVPAADLLRILGERFGNSGENPFFVLPTVFWFTGASDFVIHASCLIGCVLAVLVISGFYSGPSLLGLWVVYLSLQKTGGSFMGFQWDILLLEAGFLCLLVAPWSRRLQWRKPNPLNLVNRIGLLMFWCLAAKLMFLSGWVKLAWATESSPEWWPEHTAMTFHYMTQPLPTWTAWWAHQLPIWFHKFTIWPMYAVELVFPFLILLGKRMRLVAALGFAGLMLLIMMTGNYTYFNWLTIVISLSLVADRFWPAKLLNWFRIEKKNSKPLIRKPEKIALLIVSPVILLLVLLNTQIVLSNFHNAPIPLLKKDLTPNWLDKIAETARPFQLASGYGLFRTMTTTRPEIILEGSSDGISWISYNFKWKPDDLDDAPHFIAPHQPRVAWQLWFAALEGGFNPRGNNARWFQSLIVKLLNGEESVQVLFERNPFPNKAPKHLRARLYEYEFTTTAERKKAGNWWRRVRVGEFLPVVSKR